ncbi:hypothetical protein [Laceyella putida]|uniref:Uncharacterized protein n=1 Tax=Laceyella putida TaxID=110101 RepID=A0ABW2RR53_9BACL
MDWLRFMGEDWFGNLGQWVGGIATVISIYFLARSIMPKPKIVLRSRETISGKYGKYGNYVIRVGTTHAVPVIIYDIGVIIRRPLIPYHPFIKWTKYQCTWGKKFVPLARFKVLRGAPELPSKLVQGDYTDEILVDYVQLANMIKDKMKSKYFIIQFYFEDMGGRRFCSKRGLVEPEYILNEFEVSKDIKKRIDELNKELNIN